ncbi:zinc-dependent metalloprotease [Pedobacter sp. HDW13]|uniref:zinc-dependent metalloprotease n=1 Tax=Pedobacter sp. HDW13 TaxID=2714940 RepID=UPI00140AA05D|nr:zinc-dependent metalloprotease [Pedobacter sp. HDW13]QIL40511.1 zinc-dependent metalloprotease [Pedobacter sp. HDW13]
MIKLKFIPVFALVLFAAEKGFAQDSTSVTKPVVVAKLKPYNQVITAKSISKLGLFTVHKVDERYYFEIPDELLSREFLFTTRLSKVPTGSPRYSGDLMNGIIVSFEKAAGDKLFVRAITNVAQSDPSNELAKAVKNATIDPIIMVLDLKARSVDGKSSVVEMTDFFLKDNLISGFHPAAKKQMGTGAPAADRSAILGMEAYPNNIEVKSLKTYALAVAPRPAAADGDSPADASAPAPSSVGVTFEISNSVMVLPKEAMKIQAYDPRVGFKSDSYTVFSDAQQKVEERRFIIKNRLEVKPEDLKRYQAGELVEPKEPLVYYIDPATPKQYRKYMIAGINNWNEAFKAAGFKNAIIGKEWPVNDKSMDLEDGRFRVIRYMPAISPFVDNNQVTDPRSGEIIQTYIGWSHSQVKTLHDWYMIQAGAADKDARNMKFSEELMGALIQAEISRTVGFTLGLTENLGSSYAIPLEKLRDKNWLANHPFNYSIMDYNHYNYVAQPADQVSRKGLIPQISDYDKWAIKWAYTNTGATSFEADKKIRLGWIKNNLNANTNLIFASQPAGIKPTDITNPTAQWEDLSNNPVGAAAYGIKNLKYVMANLIPWTTTGENTYYNTSDLYYTLVSQYSFFMRYAFTQIGGVTENLKTVDQVGDVYVPVAKIIQKQAVAFLNKEVFNTPNWILDPNVLNKFRKPAKKEDVTKMQEDALFKLIDPNRLFRMNTATMRFGKDKTYTVDEMLTDLRSGLYAEFKNHQMVDGNKRYLQKFAVNYLLKYLAEGEVVPDPTKDVLIAGTDIPLAMRKNLKAIEAQCKAAIPTYTDPVMLAHLKYISDKINNALNPKN